MIRTTPSSRNIEFIGEHKNDSIVIGNYGDARFTAKGNFTLSGIIFCRRSTVVTLPGQAALHLQVPARRSLFRELMAIVHWILARSRAKWYVWNPAGATP